MQSNSPKVNIKTNQSKLFVATKTQRKAELSPLLNRKQSSSHQHERVREMYRCSNTVIGFLNLLTLLSSIPIIGGGLWMAKSKTSCESFLQTPLLIIGFVILILSLAGFIGSCFHVAWVLWLYLAVMFLLIAALMALTVFGFIVTNRGGGVEVPGRIYKEYHLENYSPWLRKRLKNPRYWETIRTCILGSKTCAKIAYWTPFDYLQRDMSPIQVSDLVYFSSLRVIYSSTVLVIRALFVFIKLLIIMTTRGE